MGREEEAAYGRTTPPRGMGTNAVAVGERPNAASEAEKMSGIDIDSGSAAATTTTTTAKRDAAGSADTAPGEQRTPATIRPGIGVRRPVGRDIHNF